MTEPDDLFRWDEKYQEERYNSFYQPRQFLIDHAEMLPKAGIALDVAMGLGGNAGFLIDRGLSVIGVDISAVAVKRAKKQFPHIMAVQADLTRFYLPNAYFDVILNFFYLQRDLFPIFPKVLRPGGLLLIETMTRKMLEIKPEIDPKFLLAPNELREAFASSMEIISYHEGWTLSHDEHRRAVASMAARLPG